MKTIELTEKHKSKLLEMCKVLFPEYHVIQFTFNNDSYFTDKWSDTPNFGDILSFSDSTIKTGRSILNNIHWFEFVMTKLPNKLNLAFCDIGDLASSLNGDKETEMFNTHPIDYLYEQFLKLKL